MVLDTAVPWSVPFTSDPRLLVRRAVPEDLASLAALKRRVESRCYGHLATHEALAVRLHRRATAWWLLGRLGAGDLLLLAQRDDALIGLGAASLEADAVHLHSGYVEREGYGAGRALLAARLEAADALGVRRVTADAFVGCEVAAARLRRLGMLRVGPVTASPSFPGVPLSHWTGSVHTALVSLGRRSAS